MNLSARQADVLFIVRNCGPVRPTDVGEYHMPIGLSAARSALRSLHSKGLIRPAFLGYVITAEGVAALVEQELADEQDLNEHMRWRDKKRKEHNSNA